MGKAMTTPAESDAKQEETHARSARRAEHVRDHLANERTLLSWVRLGLSLTALGFVIARFGIFLEQMVPGGQVKESTPHFSVPIGVGLVLLGPVLVALAAQRFFITEREIDAEQAQSHYRLLYLILAAVGLTGLVLAGYLVYVWITLDLP
jgi:putative membrane protein